MARARVVTALLAAASLGACGGRTTGLLPDGTQSMDERTMLDGVGMEVVDAGEPADEALKKVTLVVVGATGEWPSPCNLSQNDVIIYDAVSHTFAWDFCAWDLETGDNVPRNGIRTLTRYETNAVLNTLSLMRQADTENCAVDRSESTLDVEYGATTKHYIQVAGTCAQVPPEQTYPVNASQLFGWFYELAYETKLPTTFDGFSLRGLPIFNPQRDPSTGCDETFQDEYHVEAVTRQFTWRHCLAQVGSAVYHAYQGSKRLTTEEYASLLVAVSQLELGNSGPCGEMLPLAYVSFDVPTYLPDFVTETEACNRDSESHSSLYTVNIDQLRDKLRALAY